MELRAGLASNAPLRRRFGFLRAPNYQKKKSTSNYHNVVEVMVPKVNGNIGGVVSSCREGDGGVVRMKIVVKKSELKQLVDQVMRSGVTVSNGELAHNNRPIMPHVSVPSSSSVVEQRLNLLKKKHVSRANHRVMEKGNHHKCWSPELQSIPEEL